MSKALQVNDKTLKIKLKKMEEKVRNLNLIFYKIQFSKISQQFISNKINDGRFLSVINVALIL